MAEHHVKASELRLGDIVRLSSGPFADAIVCKVTQEFVTFYRPYGRADDFSYGDPPQVTCLTGAEIISVYTYGTSTYEVLWRGEVK